MTSAELLVALLILAAALVYSAVGHGGASAYLAVMALAGLAPEVMKPAALALNILVAGVASARFARAGHLSWPLVWPFAITSIPAAFIGGVLTLPVRGYQIALGGVLVYAAVRMLAMSRRAAADQAAIRPPLAPALMAGGAIGLLSGLIGVGGGIFLSPLLLLLGWAGIRATAAASAIFIVVNSVAGLAGYMLASPTLPAQLPIWAVAALAGGWVGAGYGSRRLPPPAIRRLLAAVLLVAGAKLILLS